MNKPSKSYPRRLSEFLKPCLGDAFARQGFASADIVTRWREIVGADIASRCEPIKLQWPRSDVEQPEPATLVLRVDGPGAIEIQHMSEVILERINRFFGWRAVKRIAIRQAPLLHRDVPPAAKADPEAARRIEENLPPIEDESLRQALARLGAAINQA